MLRLKKDSPELQDNVHLPLHMQMDAGLSPISVNHREEY